MKNSRRAALELFRAQGVEHAGLWLDKFMEKQLREGDRLQDKEKTPQTQLVSQTANITEPASYAAFYGRWQNALQAYGALMREAEVVGRMVIGLGDESVLETAVTLHHTYGVPYIPGSALKGLAASFARQRLQSAWQKPPAKPEDYLRKREIAPEPPSAYRILFGDTDEAGYVTFFDALYVPGSGIRGKALYPDVITVHHPDYYQAGKTPADWDSPTPIPYLSATGRYLIALAGPDEEWVGAAFKILGKAMEEEGIGAKTSSGYGRLHLLGEAKKADTHLPGATEPAARVDPEQQVVDEFVRQLQALPNAKVGPEIGRFIEKWRSLNVRPALKQQAALALFQKVKDAGRERASLDKPWYQELLASIQRTEG